MGWHPIALDAEVEGTEQPSGQKLISMREVARHNTRDDCWVVIQVRSPRLSWKRVLIPVGRATCTTSRISWRYIPVAPE